MFATQSIQRPNGISVFASHLIRTEPDYASVRFTVEVASGEPKDSLKQANDAVARVHAVLSKANIADADVRTSRSRLELAYEGYGEKRHVVGYRASRSFQLFVRDLAIVESILVDIVDAGGRTINSVSYKSTQLRELRRQAREGAVSAARTKAEVYARAAGVGLGRAIHIEDVNPEQMSRRSHAPDVDMEGHSDGTGGAGSIVIAGAVMMSFAIVDSAN